jgi:hypothetical protein
MQIEFRKIPYTKSDFEIKDDLLVCYGTFFKESNRLISVDIVMSGKITVDCDICGDTFDLSINEKQELKVSDGVSEKEDLDIIECQNHVVDFDEIVESEIASIRSDYHYCKNCKNQGE